MKERITVTIDADIAAKVKALAGEGSTSSVVERALREMLTRQRNARARLDQMLQAHARQDPEGYERSRERVRRQLGLEETQ